jgi:hypothetical protein
MPAGSFTADITAIRERARQKMEEGPVTGSYGKDRGKVIAVLEHGPGKDPARHADQKAHRLI